MNWLKAHLKVLPGNIFVTLWPIWQTEVSGVSRDLLDEVAKRLNLKLEYIHAEYAALISGVEADRFDVASGGISDTVEREEKLDFVNYMFAGGSMLILADGPMTSAKTIDDFCGKSIATLLGSRVLMTAVEAASERCTKAGKQPIRAEQLPAAPDARMQLDLKRVDSYIGDLPALVYMGSQFPGKYRIVGGAYILTPYVTSWGFGKNRAGLRDAVQKAMQGMLEDGTYKKILAKSGLDGAALPVILSSVTFSLSLRMQLSQAGSRKRYREGTTEAVRVHHNPTIAAAWPGPAPILDFPQARPACHAKSHHGDA